VLHTGINRARDRFGAPLSHACGWSRRPRATTRSHRQCAARSEAARAIAPRRPPSASRPGGDSKSSRSRSRPHAAGSATPPVRGRVGHPRRRPARITADRGYDHDKYRLELRRYRTAPEIARRQTEHGSGLGALAGLSSAPSPGCTTSSGCLFATTPAPRSTKPSSHSAAASSASGGFDGHSDRFLSVGSHSPEVDIVDADAGGRPVAGRRG
jgi:hypothetical protein